jgi:hypothetical protein
VTARSEIRSDARGIFQSYCCYNSCDPWIGNVAYFDLCVRNWCSEIRDEVAAWLVEHVIHHPHHRSTDHGSVEDHEGKYVLQPAVTRLYDIKIPMCNSLLKLRMITKLYIIAAR